LKLAAKPYRQRTADSGLTHAGTPLRHRKLSGTMDKSAVDLPRKAAIGNLVLVALAFILPITARSRSDGFGGATLAALLFIIPSTLALVIGVMTAISTYAGTRRAGKPMPWIGMAPLGIYCVAMLTVLVLVWARAR
jgi:hypothetical protein